MSTSHGIHHEMVVNGIARYADVTVSVYLLLQGFDEVVQEGEVPVGARFCVGEVVEARELEPQGVAPLATVHVVPERQHDLQELLESLAALYFLGCFQDSCINVTYHVAQNASSSICGKKFSNKLVPIYCIQY